MISGRPCTQCQTCLLLDHNSDEAGLVTGVRLLSLRPVLSLHLLIDPPAVIEPTPLRGRRVSRGPAIVGGVGLTLLITLLLLGYRANDSTDRDVIAAFLLLIGSVQLVRFTRQPQFVVGLRAALLCLALVVASVTPWTLTTSIIVGAILGALRVSEILRRRPYRHRP